MNGYAGRLLYVNLTTGAIEAKVLSDDLARNFIGGYGIGARVLYDMIKPGADPLGPDNVIGFVTGPLNGTGALFGGRYTVVCKSPVTGGWNDANSGGFFGPEMKKAGFDGVFVSGAAEDPVYLFIKDGKAEIRDAKTLWGKDCTETEAALIGQTGEPGLRAAVIGPGGENLSLMACVINDKHRAAGRGGCGAVMGSKKLKAVVVKGSGKISPADPARLKKINGEVLDFMKNGPTVEILKGFGAYGTGSGTAANAMTGDSPIKNWGGVGAIDIGEERLMNLATFTFDAKYNTKKYACANCPLGCGAHYTVTEGKWPIAATDRPEYETLGAFGTMTLNSNTESIIKCNDICNLYGLDTISVGATVAWAIECYENGLFSQKDTDGIALTWGNADAIVAMTQAIADQRGLGKTLALGSAKAAEVLGKGKEYLQTVQGIELPMHDPRNSPGFARTYQYDPTPGRHVKGGIGLPEMGAPAQVKYTYEGKGQSDAGGVYRAELLNAAGLCMFGTDFGMPPAAIPAFIEAVTGWPFDDAEAARTGRRILNMRHAFNLREGIRANDNPLPPRSVGEPPLTAGPLKGVTVNHASLVAQFLEAVGWDQRTLRPSTETLKELGGMDDVAESIQRAG